MNAGPEATPCLPNSRSRPVLCRRALGFGARGKRPGAAARPLFSARVHTDGCLGWGLNTQHIFHIFYQKIPVELGQARQGWPVCIFMHLLNVNRPVTSDSEILSAGQSQVLWTTLPDIRDRFRTCSERDRIPFFLGFGGTKYFTQEYKLGDL